MWSSEKADSGTTSAASGEVRHTQGERYGTSAHPVIAVIDRLLPGGC